MKQLLIRRPVGKALASSQATQGIPFETLEGLYREVLDHLDKKGVENPAWLDGTDFNCPGYNEAKDRLNGTWLACLEGKTRLEDFKEALATYEQSLERSGE